MLRYSACRNGIICTMRLLSTALAWLATTTVTATSPLISATADTPGIGTIFNHAGASKSVCSLSAMLRSVVELETPALNAEHRSSAGASQLGLVTITAAEYSYIDFARNWACTMRKHNVSVNLASRRASSNPSTTTGALQPPRPSSNLYRAPYHARSFLPLSSASMSNCSSTSRGMASARFTPRLSPTPRNLTPRVPSAGGTARRSTRWCE